MMLSLRSLRNTYRLNLENKYKLLSSAKWREDMQNGTLDKQWREYAKHAWDIAPTLGKPSE
jgi:hypothetical protein